MSDGYARAQAQYDAMEPEEPSARDFAADAQSKLKKAIDLLNAAHNSIEETGSKWLLADSENACSAIEDLISELEGVIQDD